MINSGDRRANDVYVRLENDIDLGGKEWTPIGYKRVYAFSGIFDGNGYTISNFKAGSAESLGTVNYKYYGLFGYLGSNAVVRNLKVRTSIGISDSVASSGRHSNGIYAGAVAGYALDALVKDVDVAAEIGINVLATYEICAGAIVGKADGFNLDDIKAKL
mgnify:CR=1 FL=1